VASCGADGNIIVTHVPSADSTERSIVRVHVPSTRVSDERKWWALVVLCRSRVHQVFSCHNDVVNKIVLDPNDPNVFFTCGGKALA